MPLDSNPYQESLYGPMRATHPNTVEVVYWRRRPWVGIIQFFPLAAWCALKGARIAHVHWLAWDLRLRVPRRAKISGVLCRLAIWWLQVLALRIIWTVHNVVPHEPQTDNDIDIMRSLARASAAMIVHSEAVKKALEKNGIPTVKAIVIPQGSYIDMYGSPPSVGEARRALGLPPTGRVVLSFGLIRPYKGIPELLADWSDAHYEGALVIAGSCPDPVLRAEIEGKARDQPSVSLHLDFVPDAEVPWFFAASDCVCLPFRSSTTSSSALLALSFAKPVVAPRLGALEDLPADVGYFYDHSDESGLHGALKRFFAEGELALRHRSEAGLAHARTLAWPAIAEQTLTLYRTVIAASPPDPSGSPAPTSRGR